MTENVIDTLVDWVELLGAAMIVAGIAITLVRMVRVPFMERRPPLAALQIRLGLGMFLALGLEFLLAADILRTAVAPTWEDIGQLAAIAAIRTGLNYFLGREFIQGEHEIAAARQRTSMPALPALPAAPIFRPRGASRRRRRRPHNRAPRHRIGRRSEGCGHGGWLPSRVPRGRSTSSNRRRPPNVRLPRPRRSMTAARRLTFCRHERAGRAHADRASCAASELSGPFVKGRFPKLRLGFRRSTRNTGSLDERLICSTGPSPLASASRCREPLIVKRLERETSSGVPWAIVVAGAVLLATIVSVCGGGGTTSSSNGEHGQAPTATSAPAPTTTTRAPLTAGPIAAWAARP